MDDMTDKDEARAWLMSRRARVTPEQAGLPGSGGADRRVPGLRREEVAMLADVSIDYYTKIERGDLRGASESVLNAIARALQLDDVERAHLFALAGTAPSVASGHRTPTAPLPASVQRVLDSMAVPAFAYNARQDLLGANLLGRALYSMHFEADQPNLARFIFLDSRARKFFADWELACSLTAAMLRYEAGRDPLDEDLTALIGELSTRSPQFRTHWADRDVHEHRTGTKVYRHPEVGDLELTYDVLELSGRCGLSITTFSAQDGTASADKLSLLASWAASRKL